MAALPASMDRAHQAKLDGKDFEKEYGSMRITAHKNAVSLFERYDKSVDNAILKDWAGRTLPHLQGHLKMAHDLDK
jgi:putative membrane protein